MLWNGSGSENIASSLNMNSTVIIGFKTGCYHTEIVHTESISLTKFTKINDQVVYIVDSASTLNYSSEKIVARIQLEVLSSLVCMYTI
jgi:hypothetical protein